MPALALLKDWKLLLGILTVGILGMLLLIFKAESIHYRKLYTAAESGRQLEIAKHAVTTQSLNTCISSINDMNAAVARLKADGDARQDAAAKAAEAARRDAEGAEAHARALEASAKASGSSGACKGSPAYEAARGGL